MKAADWCGK